MYYLLLIALVSVVVLGVFAFLIKKYSKESEQAPQQQAMDNDCCGAHAVCEKTRLVALNDKPEYYDDEELDVLANRDATDYTDEEIKQIEEVFYTLPETDVAGWLCSLQVRNIHLPEYIKEQALMIVAEKRAKAHQL